MSALAVGGREFRDAITENILLQLLQAAQRGKVLVTSRYPLPSGMEWCAHEHLGPLSVAETRKLCYRLPSLTDSDPETLWTVLECIGGPPRLLEYLDAILRKGEARLPAVASRLRDKARDLGLDPARLGGD